MEWAVLKQVLASRSCVATTVMRLTNLELTAHMSREPAVFCSWPIQDDMICFYSSSGSYLIIVLMYEACQQLYVSTANGIDVWGMSTVVHYTQFTIANSVDIYGACQ